MLIGQAAGLTSTAVVHRVDSGKIGYCGNDWIPVGAVTGYAGKQQYGRAIASVLKMQIDPS